VAHSCCEPASCPAAQGSVRLHVKRLAIAIGLWTYLSTASIAEAMSCLGPSEGLSRFIEQSVQFADRVVLVRVTSVSDKGRSAHMAGPSAAVELLKSFKGTGTIAYVDQAVMGGITLRSGETLVLFTDVAGIIVPCSDYRPWLTREGVMLEIERILKRRAT
jgi:hypothetical protein